MKVNFWDSLKKSREKIENMRRKIERLKRTKKEKKHGGKLIKVGAIKKNSQQFYVKD